MRRVIQSGKPLGPAHHQTPRRPHHAPAAAANPRSSEEADMARAIQASLAEAVQAQQAAAAKQPESQIDDEAFARALQESLNRMPEGPAPQVAPQAPRAAAARAPRQPQAAAKPAAHPDELPLPKSLQGLPRTVVHHIRVTQQGDSQCGSRSVANALAVQDLITANLPLTAANIRNFASKYDSILINYVIEDDMVRQIVQQNNLFNAHIMSRNAKEAYDAAEAPFIIQSANTHDSSVDELVLQLRTEATITAHIICNTGGHWVLITIVKQKDFMPQILFMDSGNGPLEENAVTTESIRFLYNACLS